MELGLEDAAMVESGLEEHVPSLASGLEESFLSPNELLESGLEERVGVDRIVFSIGFH